MIVSARKKTSYFALCLHPAAKNALCKLPAKSHALLFFPQQQAAAVRQTVFLTCVGVLPQVALVAFVTSQRANFQTCVSQRLDCSQPFAFGFWGVHRQDADMSLFIENISQASSAASGAFFFGGGEGVICLLVFSVNLQKAQGMKKNNLSEHHIL